MKTLITILFTAFIIKASAQLPAPDTINSGKGNITIQPVFHAALVLQWNNRTIYVDPYNGADAYKNLKKPDLILITDIHGDHMDLKTLQALDLSAATLIVPQAV